MKEILLGVDGMSLEDLVAIAREGYKVRLTEESEDQIIHARKMIEKWVTEERVIYGVTTGFGALSDVTISKEDTQRLQENILMSHAAGVGDILDKRNCSCGHGTPHQGSGTGTFGHLSGNSHPHHGSSQPRGLSCCS